MDERDSDDHRADDRCDQLLRLLLSGLRMRRVHLLRYLQRDERALLLTA